MKETFYQRLTRVYDLFKREHNVNSNASLSTIILGTDDYLKYKKFQTFHPEGNRCTHFDNVILKKNKKYFIYFKI